MTTGQAYAETCHADVVAVQEDLGKFRCCAGVVTVIASQSAVVSCAPWVAYYSVTSSSTMSIDMLAWYSAQAV